MFGKLSDINIKISFFLKEEKMDQLLTFLKKLMLVTVDLHGYLM
jgi:hypothetical protein